MQYGCIGEKLGHSFSPELHARLRSNPYELCELAPEHLQEFFLERSFCGVNVTIPYKQAVIPLLDEIDPLAQRVGAVNTVVNAGGKLIGYNTDLYGLRCLICAIGVPLTGKTVAILGTGGTARTATAVAIELGAKRILHVSRHAQADAVTYEMFEGERSGEVQILINTTPLGMYPNGDGCAVDLRRFSALEAVVDVVYNPLRTRLVLEAAALGIPARGGLLMLAAQAVRASELFTDSRYPDGTAERLCAAIANEKEDLVLSGMPGSGKSTVGALLARRTGRPFIDLDKEITTRLGATPAELITRKGEAAFREIEASVLRKVLSEGFGRVLALGGGTILREENVARIRRNGRVYFLDRPLDELTPTADRPLSDTKAALKRLYGERIVRYRTTADVCISGFHTPEEAVNLIERDRKRA